MNKINKNGNLNSTLLESKTIKSESDKENKLKNKPSIKIEELNNKTRDGITRRNAILRKVKESPPINESGMRDKISKPLPDLPHGGLNLKVRQTKPLPPLPTTHQPLPQIHSQVKVQSQPQPRLNFKEIPIKNLPITEMNKQIESFKNAAKGQSSEMLIDLTKKLNDFASKRNNLGEKSEEINTEICKAFALYGERAANYQFNPKPEIKEALVKFSISWLTTKIKQKDETLTRWDDAISSMALSVQKKSKGWGMEF